jgi:predicted TPR repeat methyltransferase
MEPTGKRRSSLSFAAEVESVLRDQLIRRPKAWLADARVKIRDLPKTNFDLGCDFADQGKWFDAVFRFRVTLYLQPDYPQAWYNLGCSYFRLNKKAPAIAAFRKSLAQTPGDVDTIFMLSIVDPASVPVHLRPQTMPKSMVAPFFAAIAQDYDALELQNQYRGGVVVAEQVKPLLPSQNLAILDVGCGTGIAARPWRGLARAMIGVDFTKNMVEMAKKLNLNNQLLFDQVVEADARTLPESIANASMNLGLVVNVAPFLGDLTGVFVSLARVLGPGGLVALTVEPFTGADGFGLVAATSRFGHSAAYVKKLADTHGFALMKEVDVVLYPDARAHLFVLQKGTI